MFRILNLFKKKECVQCREKSRETINYAGYDICSESCMIEFFKPLSTKKLIELEIKDMEINKDFYKWLSKKNLLKSTLLINRNCEDIGEIDE